MSTFSFRAVDERSFPYLRGIGTFFDLFEEKRHKIDNLLCGVCSVAGHIAAIFHEGTTLCLFDSVPASFRLSDVSSRLLVEILTKRKPVAPHSLTDMLLSAHSSPIVRVSFDKGPPLRLVAVQQDGMFFVWEWVASEWTWKLASKFNIYLIAGKTLKDAGFCFFGDKESVVYLENSNNLYVRQLQLPKFDATKKRLEDSQLLPTFQSPVLVANISDPKGKMLAGKGGLWILASNLYFYSYRFQKLVTINYGAKTVEDDELGPSTSESGPIESSVKFRDDNPPILEQITAATIHPDTQELLLLDPHGFLFVCPPDRFTITFIATLHSSPSSSDSSPSPSLSSSSSSLPVPFDPTKPLHIFVKHHLLFVLQEDTCGIHDLKTGTLVTQLQLPTQSTNHSVQPWETSPGFLAFSIGIWSAGGIWELKTPPALKQAELLVSHTTQKRVVNYEDGLPRYTEIQTGGAPPLCHDWGMDKWEAKYLLDTTLTSNSESVKREASKQLLPMLESPALILALLSSTQSDHFLLEELKTFLDNYHSGGSDNDRERAKAAFLYHSPLNEKLAPLLDKYYKVSIESHCPPKEIPADLHHFLSNLAPRHILKQEASTWEMLMRGFPDLFLAKLEEILGLSQIEEFAKGGIAGIPQALAVQRILFEPEEGLPLTHAAHAVHAPHDASPAIAATPGTESGARKAAVFETMVKLYYAHKPHLLPFFVQLVSRMYERSITSSHRGSWSEQTHKPPEFHARALLALPPLPDGEIPDAQLTCRFEILCASGNLADGLRLLLDYDRWDQALAFAKSRMDHDVDHFMLFQILLSHALKARSTARLSQIWEVMPHGFGIFDLLALVRHLLIEDSDEERVGKVMADDDEEILMVEVFRPQLLRMWSASKHGEPDKDNT
eukprot:Phypoly_transcript_01998.p1 GENE.Phypoly_transcript_01998~~Phypoly_transcript_01998.p1  ORF type:complete len:894 (+),score=143.30 Phypoly_transcript_01998:101-2782(+)